MQVLASFRYQIGVTLNRCYPACKQESAGVLIAD
jgi:hypothetical protein